MRQAKTRGDIGQVVFEAGPHDVVVLVAGVGKAIPGIGRKAMQTEDADFLSQGGVVRRHHAALAGRHVLGDVEAETRQVTDRADLASAVATLDSVRGILDDKQVVAPSDGRDGIHVGGSSGKVNRHDGSGPRRYGRLDGGRIDVHAVALAVCEHRRGARVQDGVRGCTEGHRCRDHLVAGAHARGHHGQVQSGRAGRGGECVLRLDVASELGLELVHARPRADPARLHGSRDRSDGFAIDGWAAEHDVAWLTHAQSPVTAITRYAGEVKIRRATLPKRTRRAY